MPSMGLVEHFSQLETELKLLWTVVSNFPPRMQTDVRCFANAIQDWRLVCRRYDRECLEYRAVVHELFHPALSVAGPTAPHGNKEAEDRFHLLLEELPVDIRSFYIFGQIAYRTVLDLVKRLSRHSAPDLQQQFDSRFDSEHKWFEAHVGFYRNSFVEHPRSAARVRGLGSSASGLRITGLTGAGLTQGNDVALEALQRKLRETLPDFAAVGGMDAYDWMCGNLEKIPQSHRPDAETLMLSVGRESGELDEIASRTTAMFARFLAFLRDWVEKSGGNVGVPRRNDGSR